MWIWCGSMNGSCTASKSRRAKSARFLIVASVVAEICAVAFSFPIRARAFQSETNSGQFHVVKVLCGSKGELHGTEYVMEDPKTVFHVPQDHQIVVSFEWQGPPGTHHAVGAWRGPDGKVALTTDFDLNSGGSKYIGTWTLAIPASIPPGLWALEVRVDGQPAGSQIIQIISTQAEEAPKPPPMPTAAEVYKRISGGTVLIANLDKDGEIARRGFGFFTEKDTLLTAFEVIDGAASVKLNFADGSSVTAESLVAWNRAQDWAILRVPSDKAEILEHADANSWKVGDVCYLMVSQGNQSRSIQTVNITGLEGKAQTGQRMTISGVGAGDSAGGPVLDGYGRVIGVLGGGELEGAGTFIDPEVVDRPWNPTILPLTSIPQTASSSQPTSLADLATRGLFINPIVHNPQAVSGQLCEETQRIGRDAIVPVRPNSQFSRKRPSFSLIITWGPNQRITSTQELRIYDLDNHEVLHVTPTKIKLEPRVTTYSTWKIPTAPLQAGAYRIDLLLGDQPEWRSYFQISE